MTTHAVEQNTNQAQQTSQELQVPRSGLERPMAQIQEAYQRDLIEINQGFPLPQGYQDKSKLNQNEKTLLAQVKKGKISIKDLAKNGHHKIIGSLARSMWNGKLVSQARHQMAADIMTTIPVDQVEMLAKGRRIPKAIQGQKFHRNQRVHRDTQKITTDDRDKGTTIGNTPTDNVWDKALVKMAKADLVARQGHVKGAQGLRDRRVNNVLAQEQKKLQQAQTTAPTPASGIITPTIINSPTNGGIITPTITNSPTNGGIITPTATHSPAAKPNYRPTNTPKAEAAGVILNGSKILKRGMEGPEVEVLSGFLAKHGYDTGSPANQYGPATETAVVRIQEKIKAKLIEKAGDDPSLKAKAEEFLIDGRFGPETAKYSREFLGLKEYIETGSVESEPAGTATEPETMTEPGVEVQAAEPEPEPTTEPDTDTASIIQTENPLVQEALTLLESNIPLDMEGYSSTASIMESETYDEINESLAKLNNEQLEEVKGIYKGPNGEGLKENIEERKDMTGENLDELEERLAGKGAKADAIALEESIVGLGTDEVRIKTILGNRTSEQIDQIVEEYNKVDKNGFWGGKGQELFPALESDLSGQDWENVKSLLAKNAGFQKYLEEKTASSFYGAAPIKPSTDTAATTSTQNQVAKKVEQLHSMIMSADQEELLTIALGLEKMPKSEFDKLVQGFKSLPDDMTLGKAFRRRANQLDQGAGTIGHETALLVQGIGGNLYSLADKVAAILLSENQELKFAVAQEVFPSLSVEQTDSLISNLMKKKGFKEHPEKELRSILASDLTAAKIEHNIRE